MLAWIKGKQLTDFSKWELAEAFRRASDKNTGLWKPKYCALFILRIATIASFTIAPHRN